jgi:hypothetical protein
MKLKLKEEKGQSMVEFAMILPVLLLIIIGIIEFGFMFSGYLALSNASREAVRTVSLGETDTVAIQRAKDVAIILNPSKMIVSINPSAAIRDRGDSVRVTIVYEYDFLTPFMESLFGGNLQLEAEATMRVE